MKILLSTFVMVSFLTHTNPSQAQISVARKISLAELNEIGIQVDVAALKREETYNKNHLSLADKAKLESQLLIEAINKATLISFEKSFKEIGNVEIAKKEVLELMEGNLELVSENLKPILRNQVLQTLENLNQLDAQVIPDNILDVMKEKSIQRSELLKFVDLDKLSSVKKLDQKSASNDNNKNDNQNASVIEVDNRGPISPREYKQLSDIALELVKDKRNERWVNSTNLTLRVGQATSKKEKIGIQVSVEFMGVKGDFGPTITFWRDYTTTVSLNAEGMAPIFNENGIFDFYKRDQTGKAIRENGVLVRRLLLFTCDANQNFGTEYSGEGNFKLPVAGGTIGGVGLGVEVEGQIVRAKSYTNSVSLESRRLQVPDSINGKQVTVANLAEVCHSHFLNTKVENGKTVKENLNTVMKNLISGLTFSSPKILCQNHSQCNSWYEKEVVALHKFQTAPRCIEQNRQEAVYGCELRGTKGANCTIVKNGKVVSSGSFEYRCDQGLTCKTVHEGGWFQNWSTWDPYVGNCL